MFNLSIIELEKKSVFFINSFLIILIVAFMFFGTPIKYFFYFNIFLTLIVSYFFFKRSRNLSKYLIVTNMFIFFYFLFPIVAEYLNLLLGKDSYIFILFYNILIASIFLIFSGEHKEFLKNIKKFNIKIFLIVILVGLVFGLLFYLVREPIPTTLSSGLGLDTYVLNSLIFTLILALSEQMIFSGFLFNIYNKLTNKRDSFFQVATIFVLFHLLRFEQLVISYFQNFHADFLFLITIYYVLLFLFMLSCLYFYSFKSKKYNGSFIYPVTLHFVTDFSMLIMIKLLG